MTEIEKLIQEGRDIIAAEVRRQKLAEDEAERQAQARWEAAEAAALLLVPTEVREYCSLEMDGGNTVLRITLPDAAVLEQSVAIRQHGSREPEVSFLQFSRQDQNGWRIRQYEFWDETGEVELTTKDTEPYLAVALARAVELGDHLAEADAEATRRMLARQAREQQKPDPVAPFCPLTAGRERCRGQHCAWWHADQKACSILVLAASKA